jgi:hypothetical protein
MATGYQAKAGRNKKKGKEFHGCNERQFTPPILKKPKAIVAMAFGKQRLSIF